MNEYNETTQALFHYVCNLSLFAVFNQVEMDEE